MRNAARCVMMDLFMICLGQWFLKICVTFVVLIPKKGLAGSVHVDVCTAEYLNLECDQGDIVVIDSALLGRMEQGRCIPENVFIGCTNNVLHILDKLCSGRSRCKSIVPNNEMKEANKECASYLQVYLQISYHCLTVKSQSIARCSEPATITGVTGVIASHVTDETGCGSADYPWIIKARSGQMIKLRIIDFGSEVVKMTNMSQTTLRYGYIRENNERTAFAPSTIREREVYTSKSNVIQIEVSPKSQRHGLGFLIQFEKLGCPDLTPPAHAWYKRDGDQAVIGCEWSQKTWHLSCDGHSWSGVVGNCSEPVTKIPVTQQSNPEILPALWLVCVVSCSVVLMVIACVTGIVFIKKYRIKQDIQKSMTLQRIPGQGHYDLDPNIEMASMLYLPYKTPDQQQQQQGAPTDPTERPTSYLVPQDQVVNELTPIRIWERPLPELPDKPLATDTLCVATATATTKAGRTPGDGDEAANKIKPQEDNILQGEFSTTGSRNEHQRVLSLTQPALNV